MILVEKHDIKRNSKYFKILDELCLKAKNLYNATLYTVRQYYFDNKKYLPYAKVNQQFIKEQNADYWVINIKKSVYIADMKSKSVK